jgi:1,4-alpha-glucan branching enzyme
VSDRSRHPAPSAAKAAAGITREPLPTAPVPLPAPPLAAGDAARLRAGEHPEPHSVLGVHPATADGLAGLVVRAWHPDAVACSCLVEGGAELPLEADAGLFSAFLPGETLPFRYRLRFRFADGATWERDDPYRFLPTLGEVDLHLFNEGTHRRLWEKLGRTCARWTAWPAWRSRCGRRTRGG